MNNAAFMRSGDSVNYLVVSERQIEIGYVHSPYGKGQWQAKVMLNAGPIWGPVADDASAAGHLLVACVSELLSALTEATP